MLLLDVLLVLLALVVLVPALTFTVEVLLAPSRGPQPLPAQAPARPRSVVLIPAHNESLGIVGTLRSVVPQLAPGDFALVVADNCSDDTAVRARAAGATVIERTDTERRGKGYALDHGIRWLEAQVAQGQPAPAVVIFVDADCSLGPDSLERMAREAVWRDKPIQALDLMHAPAGAPLQARVAEFAWLVKNQVRPLGLRALGLPCQLMGTGMAMPWDLIRQAQLASGHLAEDMELGLALAQAGQAPVYCPEASVHSFFPTQAAGSQAQRRRWEHGHLSMIRTRGLPLLLRALATANRPLLAIALDVCVPPLASLVAVQCGLLVLTAAYALVTGHVAALVLVAAGLAGVSLGVVRAWRRFGRAVISSSELAAIPGYVLGKLPIYLDALLGRKAGWQRARREGEDAAAPKDGAGPRS